MSIYEAFCGKTVLITGNTGFKGAWLTVLMQELGAEVYGLSLNSDSSMVTLKEGFQYYADIRIFAEVTRIINKTKPDFVYHLAADAITLRSYEHPKNTFETNVMGTINLLEAVRLRTSKCSVVVVSSDKCYQNDERIWGFREDDRLGGKDPYSASKSMTEIAVSSYYSSFFKINSNISVISCRAGNVIGGGDWGAKRIVPDSIRAWIKREPVVIRNPKSTRPWSYVLDIVYGYVVACANANEFNGHAFNFGSSGGSFTVEELVGELSKNWPDRSFVHIEKSPCDSDEKEALSLKLDSEKAKRFLCWNPSVPLEDALRETANFYSKASQGFNSENLIRQAVKEYLLEHL